MLESDERSSFQTNIEETCRTRMVISGFIILLCVVVISGLCVYQYCRFAKYKTIDISGIPYADPDEYSWDIEYSPEKDGVYLVNGWILRTGEGIQSHLIDIVIEKENGTAYLVPTEMVEREDVSEMLNSNDLLLDYSASGFSTAVNVHYVSSGDRLLILYRNNGRYELVDLSESF